MAGQTAKINWREDGVPVSVQFDDPYFSIDNGLAETRHVFLEGNGLPGRFRPGFQVAELGFGTGLNLLAVWQAWLEAGLEGPLRFTSFEAFPMTVDDMAAALAKFPEVDARAAELLAVWGTGARRFELPGLVCEVIVGDARGALVDWSGAADAWFLDGFSPAKNPEMWGAELMGEVGRHTAAGGTFATYTAAGFVRKGLSEAGFSVSRVSGFGRKRHMTTGVLD
ncbi:MAG: tRNA (5-methylaminomethyl-2-thiouridine)(34)-methyltransferase MnmD [Paracoccaceae bacterium]